MKRSAFRVAALGAAATLLLAGCAGNAPAEPDSSSGPTDEPLNFTIIYGVTGGFSSFVPTFLEGSEAAKDAINAAGGVNGRQIELNIIDDKSDPTVAASVLTDLIDSGDLPDALWVGGISTEALAMLPIAAEAGLFSVSSGLDDQLNNPDAYPFFFGTSATQEDSLAVLGKEFKEKGYKSAALLIPGNADGDAKVESMETILGDAGVEVVQIERPAEDALNYDVEMQRIKDADPEVIFFDINSYDANAKVLQSRVTVGADDIPIYGGITAGGSGLKNLVDAEAVENCFLPVFRISVDDGNLPEYLAPLYEVARDNEINAQIAGYGWDFVQLSALAAERAGDDVSAQALTDALLSEPVPADVLAIFSKGTSYTADNRFPSADVDEMTIVACNTDQDAAGIWQVD